MFANCGLAMPPTLIQLPAKPGVRLVLNTKEVTMGEKDRARGEIGKITIMGGLAPAYVSHRSM